MARATRRRFLQHAGLGLAAVGTSDLVLRADAQPTPAITNAETTTRVVIQMNAMPKAPLASRRDVRRPAPLPYGPFYRTGAPFRGKLCPPGEPGTTFVLSGRVWGFDTRRPLAGAVLDFWHVDMQEKYSSGDDDFRNRGRLVSSETGWYELESIRPIPYRPNPATSPGNWRCAHFHLLAVCPGYAPLVTEIHFRDDPHKQDPMYRVENAIAVEKRTTNGQPYEAGVFDIVLERAK